MMSKLRGAFLLAFFLVFAFAASADVAVPRLTGRVVDQTGTLGAGDIASLTRKLKGFEDSKGSQIAVLMVPTTGSETIEQFSMRVADAWRIGRKGVDDGVTLVIAKNDHRLRIEVGNGLESALSYVISKRIIDEEIAPKFKSGDFAGGISAGIDGMISVINGEPLPAPKVNWQNDPFTVIPVVLVVLVFFMVVVPLGMFRSIFGLIMGSAANGGMIGLAVWWIAGPADNNFLVAVIIGFGATLALGSVFLPRRGGWYWYGAGSNWGDSESGDYSGGGGSFGGGGASGSW